jgi:plasmid stabilization system protein ParE
VSAKFHRRVQHDLDEILERYDSISEQLADDFFAEFQLGVEKATGNPRFFHHDASGLRRCNLDRFPYHFLYDIRSCDCDIRIWVVRHNRRNPTFGLKRFKN